MNRNTRVIVNTQKILPAPVATGVDTYPPDVIDQLMQRGIPVLPVDAFAIAKAAGETRAVNMVLVGALSVLLPLEEKVFFEVISERIPEKVREKNPTAFLKGKEAIKDILMNS
jgi:indolepyruvate ferredoxin oxidoreductase beta subunit